MGRKIIWGFGGARFIYNNVIVDVPYAIGKLWFIDEANAWKTKNKIFFSHTPKYRPYATIDVPNVEEFDYIPFLQLLDLINMRSAVNYKTPIIVCPRFNANISFGIEIEMFCSSVIEINDLHPNGIAQNFPLTFQGKYTQSVLPAFHNDMAVYEITGDTGDKLTGDTGVVVTGVK